MFNYSPHPDTRSAESGEFYLLHHKLHSDSLEVLVDRDTPKGSQMFEDYGDNPNALYLDHHGFVPDVRTSAPTCTRHTGVLTVWLLMYHRRETLSTV